MRKVHVRSFMSKEEKKETEVWKQKKDKADEVLTDQGDRESRDKECKDVQRKDAKRDVIGGQEDEARKCKDRNLSWPL
jgi:hypothetical protein